MLFYFFSYRHGSGMSGQDSIPVIHFCWVLLTVHAFFLVLAQMLVQMLAGRYKKFLGYRRDYICKKNHIKALKKTKNWLST